LRILLVEDHVELANGLVHSLAQSGYVTDVCHTGRAGLDAAKLTTYQLAILDLGLPDMDGMEVLRRLRSGGFTSPVLILTARDELADRIGGLDAGGDDYLQKPFAIGELEARIRALLRRGTLASSTLRIGKLSFDDSAREASIDGKPLNLTAREMTVLHLLMQRPGRIVSKQQLVESMYDWASEANPAVIEVFVSRLRRKLEEAGADVGIRVLRGLGYRLEDNNDNKD
jgi:DNA-binding response OmpR family regulator